MKMDYNKKLINRRIVKESPLISPQQLRSDIPRTASESKVVMEGRKAVEKILDGKDNRIFIIVGPCSIHDVEEAKEYAEKLSALSKKVGDKMVLIMRTYFEKPRTSLGWKGLCNDPYLDGSNDVNTGLRQARELLKYIAGKGLLSATEYLSLITAQYIGDFVSYAAIGARTTESQEHRSLASGLSVPVGFKNTTGGDVQVAINSVLASRYKHSFEGTTMFNGVAVFETSGNPYTHIILRGGAQPNYDKVSIETVKSQLKKVRLEENLVVDCSHGNSGKDYKKQYNVFHDLISQISNGDKAIKGIMIESYLNPGSQIPGKKLKKGVSITDDCLGWKETEAMILKEYKRL